MTEPRKDTPPWLLESGLVSAELPLPPHVQKLAGAQAADVDDQFAASCDGERLRALQRSGVTLLWSHFYNGYGLEFEKQWHEQLREIVGAAHEAGLKAGARVAFGSIVPELLLPEEKDAQNWMQVNQHGAWSPVGNSTSAFRPCYNSESFLRYMERVCNAAIDCGVDAVYFTDTSYNPEADACRCPLCVAAFREFLRGQYGIQDDKSRHAGHERFGHSTFTHTRPPFYKAHTGAPADGKLAVAAPAEQEWLRFKVQTLTQAVTRLSHTISKRSPLVAVGADIFESFGGNSAQAHGVHVAELSAALDLAGGKGATGAGKYSPKPRKGDNLFALAAASERQSIITQLVALKHARHTRVALEAPSARDMELNLALNLAFNAHGLGHLGSADAGILSAAWQQRSENSAQVKSVRGYIDFFTAHRQTLLNTRPVLSVGVLHDFPSIAYGGNTTTELLQFECALAEKNICFEPLHAGDLAQYRCVVLFRSQCLSDDLTRKLEAYLHTGGGLIFAGATGALDQWGRTRQQSALRQLARAEIASGLRAEINGGRLAYVAEANNLDEILDATRYAGGENPVSIDGSTMVLLNPTLSAAGQLLLHALNIDEQPARNLRLAIATATQPASVSLLVPGADKAELDFAYDNGRVLLQLPTLARYALLKF